jgi:parvulin-like peptidyl-prolyl isomerase
MEAKMLSPVMREAAMNTKVGDVTAVIEDTSAFIILRVDEKKLGTVPPLDTVRSEIEKTIKAERSAVEVEKWLAGLRAKASIKRFE